MVIEVTPQKVDPEERVKKVFLKAVELLGGFKALAEFRSLTWLPSIARAVYAVVLKEEYNRSDEEIAEQLGLTKESVRNMLRGDPEQVMEKIKDIKELSSEEGKEMRIHTAGSLARLAYRLLKEEEG